MASIHQLYFDDFQVGQSFEFGRRTVTDAHFAMFAAISGDNHPIHYDDVYAAQSKFGRRVTHGLLLVAMTALGAAPLAAALHDSMIAFVQQSARFLKPVFIGDSVSVVGTVASLTPKDNTGLVKFEVKMTSQDGDPVLESSQTYLLRRVTDDN